MPGDAAGGQDAHAAVVPAQAVRQVAEEPDEGVGGEGARPGCQGASQVAEHLRVAADEGPEQDPFLLKERRGGVRAEGDPTRQGPRRSHTHLLVQEGEVDVCEGREGGKEPPLHEGLQPPEEGAQPRVVVQDEGVGCKEKRMDKS